jgi:hypothetical protein
MRAPAALDEFRVQPAATLFRDAGEEAQRDLEKPAFLRRLGF